MRQFPTRRGGVRLEKADGSHHKPRHAERALEAFLVDHPLLHRMQRPVGGGQPFDRHDLLPAHRVRQDGTGIARHIVDEDRARAAFRAVASELGAGESQLVAQGRGERFLLQHVNAPILAVDVQRDQTLNASGRGRLLAKQRRRTPQVTRRRDYGSGGDDALDEIAPRNVFGSVFSHRLVFHEQAVYGGRTAERQTTGRR
jgi:hypothetical protein